MAANKQPIYTRAPDVQWSTNNITSANTAKDGTGTVETVFVADATEGGFVSKLRIRPRGTNVATVMRIFLNNGGSNSTAANNALIDEITLPATTNSETAAINGAEVPMNMALPPNYKINVTIGTAVAGGFTVTAIGGKY